MWPWADTLPGSALDRKPGRLIAGYFKRKSMSLGNARGPESTMFAVKRAEDVADGDVVRCATGRLFAVVDVSHDDVDGASVCITAQLIRYPGDGYSRWFTNTAMMFCEPSDSVMVTDRGVA